MGKGTLYIIGKDVLKTMKIEKDTAHRAWIDPTGCLNVVLGYQSFVLPFPLGCVSTSLTTSPFSWTALTHLGGLPSSILPTAFKVCLLCKTSQGLQLMHSSPLRSWDQSHVSYRSVQKLSKCLFKICHYLNK